MAQAKNKEEFDKYYTNDDIAKMIVSKLPNDKYLIVEPSAGDGAFIRHLTQQYIAMDIAPQHSDIKQQDYLLYTHNSTQPTITLMNPPFGTGCNLAIKFFNKAAEYSEYIYWIAPRTMLKKSKENKLSLEFTCIHSEVLPEKAFHLQDGTQKAVRTVFQIWKKQKREPHILKYALTANKSDWEFCKINDNWDFVLRLHGYSAGKIVGQSKTNFEYTLLGPRTKIYNKALAEKEVNIPFIKCNIDPQIVFNRFNEMYTDLIPLKKNSMGLEDLHRDDIIRCYEKRWG